MTADTDIIQNASATECHASTPEAAMMAEATLGGYSPFDAVANGRVESLGTKGCSPKAAQAAQDIILNINVAQGADVTINAGADPRMQSALAQFEATHGQPATSGANMANLATRTNDGPTNGRG